MISLIRKLRAEIRERIQKRRFPQSVLHSDVIIDATTTLAPQTVLFSGVRLFEVSLGEYSYIQTRTQVFNAQIGPFCSIASEVFIGLVNHPMGFVSTSPVFYDNTQPLPKFFVDTPTEQTLIPRTVIGADVWIGQRAMIKAGVKIGVGAVIGAGALVTNNVEPYAIVVGVPAHVLRSRFSVELCNRLVSTEWWLRSSEELRALNATFENPQAFLEALEFKP